MLLKKILKTLVLSLILSVQVSGVGQMAAFEMGPGSEVKSMTSKQISDSTLDHTEACRTAMVCHSACCQRVTLIGWTQGILSPILIGWFTVDARRFPFFSLRPPLHPPQTWFA